MKNNIISNTKHIVLISAILFITGACRKYQCKCEGPNMLTTAITTQTTKIKAQNECDDIRQVVEASGGTCTFSVE